MRNRRVRPLYKFMTHLMIGFRRLEPLAFRPVFRNLILAIAFAVLCHSLAYAQLHQNYIATSANTSIQVEVNGTLRPSADIDPSWAFDKGGPIIVGRVTSVQPPPEGSTSRRGTVNIEVTEQLRGETLPHAINLPFNWVDSNSQTMMASQAKGPRPTGFNRVHPAAGMQIVAFMDPENSLKRQPLEILNLSLSAHDWVSTIRNAVAMDKLSNGTKTDALLNALSNKDAFTRNVAFYSLLQGRQCQMGTSCRDRAISTLTEKARAGSEAARLEAMGKLYELYDPTAKDTASNRQIVSSLFGLILDKNPNIQGRAIVELHGVFFSGARWHPDVKSLNIPNRANVMQALEKAQTQPGTDSQKAKRLVETLKSSQ
jgi:hypothetical protein